MMSKINPKARQIVALATKKGYSYDEIADICNVSVGSVKRWLATGRANADRIQFIEDLIGPIYLSPEFVAEILVEIYRIKKKRYRLGRDQLKSVAGRVALKASFIERITQSMLDSGYYFLEGFDDDEDYFVIISTFQLNKMVPAKFKLSRDEIRDYYQTASEKIVEEEE
ncbi:MAG: hypothetical protein GY862_25585 [Gammaproteobacteria bacterium]|nr:hypothetical protein [Gammaproteobacteria bacterium]